MKTAAVLASFLVHISACASNSLDDVSESPMSNPEACASHDGEWIPLKNLYPDEDLNEDDVLRYVCNLRTHEGGNACTDDRQCKGYCKPPVGSESGQEVVGECSAFVQRVGKILTVLNGKVTYPRTSTKMTERKTAMLQGLEVSRRKWSSLGIDNYEFTIADENCYCLYGPYYGPNRITVRNGEISLVIYRGERRDGFRNGDNLTQEKALKLTVHEVFDRLEQTIRHMTGNAAIKVEYDPEYGFPSLIDFDRPDWADVQSRLVLSSFQEY